MFYKGGKDGIGYIHDSFLVTKFIINMHLWFHTWPDQFAKPGLMPLEEILVLIPFHFLFSWLSIHLINCVSDCDKMKVDKLVWYVIIYLS